MKIINFSLTFIVLLSVVVMSSCNSGANIKPVAQTAIPASCVDPSGQYQFVKGVIGSRQYNAKRAFYSPIRAKNGLIKYDFNHDNSLDYIFLERKPSESTARLMLCMSRGKTAYQRKRTAYSVREYKEMDLYVDSVQILHKGDSLSIFDSSHAHNDGGENTTRYFTFNSKRQAFTLRKYEYSASGQAFPERYQVFNLQRQSYLEEITCSFAADPIAMSYDPNCKPRKIKQCLKPAGVIFIGDRIDRSSLQKRVTACRR